MPNISSCYYALVLQYGNHINMCQLSVRLKILKSVNALVIIALKLTLSTWAWVSAVVWSVVCVQVSMESTMVWIRLCMYGRSVSQHTGTRVGIQQTALLIHPSWGLCTRARDPVCCFEQATAVYMDHQKLGSHITRVILWLIAICVVFALLYDSYTLISK